MDRKTKASLELRWRVKGPWWITAGSGLTIRRTNFPPYEPGVYPASRMYDIDWNYTNWIASLGVEHML